MNNEELDCLFRQKLEQLEGQPSTGAWQQLEQQLKHKKERKTWFYFSSIAASFLLFLGIWAGLEYSSSFIPVTPLAQEQEGDLKAANNKPSPAGETVPLPEVSRKTPAGAGNETTKQADQQLAQIAENKDQAPSQAQNSWQARHSKKRAQKAAVPVTEPMEVPQAEAKTELFNVIAEAKPAELAKPAALIEPVIISYKADLDEPGEQTVAQADKESRELTPRKVLGFLKKVKENSSGSLAELREAKDELLSLRLSRAEYNSPE